MAFRWKVLTLVVAIFLLLLIYQRPALKRYQESYDRTQPIVQSASDGKGNKFRWSEVKHSFPVTDFIPLPTNPATTIPRIQHRFGKETQAEKSIRQARLEAVKGNFTHAWNGYTSHAWLKDEVMPLSGGSMDPFGGWAASLVDTLGQYTVSRLLCHSTNSFSRYPVDHGHAFGIQSSRRGYSRN